MKQKSGTVSLSFGKDSSGCSAGKRLLEGQEQKQAEAELTELHQKRCGVDQ